MHSNKKIKSAVSLVFLFFQNLFFSSELAKIESVSCAGFVIQGLKWRDFVKFRKVLQELNHDGLSALKILLYFLVGQKYVFIAVESDIGIRRIIGIDLYYCNRRDFMEKTIHEGFIGVSEHARGKGVATSLRKAAIRHFSTAKLKGISSRISLNNHGSLASAQNLGFSPVEQYYDNDAHEERYYLVCPLEGCK